MDVHLDVFPVSAVRAFHDDLLFLWLRLKKRIRHLPVDPDFNYHGFGDPGAAAVINNLEGDLYSLYGTVVGKFGGKFGRSLSETEGCSHPFDQVGAGIKGDPHGRSFIVNELKDLYGNSVKFLTAKIGNSVPFIEKAEGEVQVFELIGH